MLGDLTLLLLHVLFCHSPWLLGNWVEEQIPSSWVLEAWIGLRQVVHHYFLDPPVPVGQSGVGQLQCQVLEVGSNSQGDTRLNGICTLVGLFCNDVRGTIYNVDIIT